MKSKKGWEGMILGMELVSACHHMRYASKVFGRVFLAASALFLCFLAWNSQSFPPSLQFKKLCFFQCDFRGNFEGQVEIQLDHLQTARPRADPHSYTCFSSSLTSCLQETASTTSFPSRKTNFSSGRSLTKEQSSVDCFHVVDEDKRLPKTLQMCVILFERSETVGTSWQCRRKEGNDDHEMTWKRGLIKAVTWALSWLSRFWTTAETVLYERKLAASLSVTSVWTDKRCSNSLSSSRKMSSFLGVMTSWDRPSLQRWPWHVSQMVHHQLPSTRPLHLLLLCVFCCFLFWSPTWSFSDLKLDFPLFFLFLGWWEVVSNRSRGEG